MNAYINGITSIIDAFKEWRVVHVLGTLQLRQRYARSKLGQFWITISLGITVIALGVVWSFLWGKPISVFLPHVAIASVLWQFMAGTINESTNTLISNSTYFFNNRLSFQASILSSLYRNLIILAHNLIIIVVACAYFQIIPMAQVLYSLAFFPIVLAVMYLVAINVTYICTRYRDLAQVTHSVINVMYFLTPIMWMETNLPEKYRDYLLLNPFASIIMLFRDPMLGRGFDPRTMFMCLAILAVLLLITPLTVSLNRKRVIYWL